jgi:transposase-like protein
MAHYSQHDWAAIRQDYLQNKEMTQESLAKKWGVSPHAIRGRSYREKWGRAREEFARQYAERLQQLCLRKDAPEMIRALNTKHLQQCDELRYMLNVLLKIRDKDGKMVLRPGVTIDQVARAVTAFAEVYRMERLALGASTDNVMTAVAPNRYDEMSEEELIEELRQVRQRVTIQ